MSKFYPLQVASIRQETRDTIIATLAVPPTMRARFAFTQGQHLTLRARVNDEELRRSYSICSATQDGDLRVAIKRTAGGRFSCWANDTLKAGVTIDVMPPAGHFNLPLVPERARRYLGVAAGSGITPIFSIVKTTLAAEPASTFTLVYGNRSSSTVIFREELADLKDLYRDRLNIVHVMSREQQDIDLFNGRITREKCDELFERWINVHAHDAAFVCGPGAMMSAVSEALQARGMPKAAIKVELFAASIPKSEHIQHQRPVVGRQECDVTVIIDGSHRSYTMAKDTESVLDAGLKQGIDIRYSCKGGVCSTCRCKVLEGKVEMDANYALEDYEIARGFILSCQAFPVTDRIVLDFDSDT
ncbi:MAG: 1,2-phenylacetyl-CoA epoxidase subunit PaaE [Pseudomonadota bacterium]